MNAWTCPLCNWSIEADDIAAAVFAHGTISHPATLPDRMDTRSRLALIPALAHEARLTMGAPNPTSTEGPGVQSGRSAAPPLPIDAGTLSALRPADDEHPWRPMTLLVECSRIVWKSFDPEQRQAHPQPIGEPRWSTECAWISDAWPDALAHLAASDIDWIEGQLADITHTLASLAGVTQPCGEPMHLGEGDWMICETGAHSHPGPVRLEREWRRKPPVSTQAVCGLLRIEQSRLWQWHKRGKIQPINPDGKPLLWLPWGVVACLYPDIVAAIDARDTERAKAS